MYAHDAPFIWDYQYWALQMDTTFLLVAIYFLVKDKYLPQKSKPRDTSIQESVLQQAGLVIRLQLFMFYFAAGFWKLNSNFTNPEISCAPVLTMQVLTYLPLMNGMFNINPELLATFFVQLAPVLTIIIELILGPLLYLPGILSQRLSDRKKILTMQQIITAGLTLGLFFHGLIAICPPPNGAGGFSVMVTARYFFFCPQACFFVANDVFSLRWMRGADGGRSIYEGVEGCEDQCMSLLPESSGGVIAHSLSKSWLLILKKQVKIWQVQFIYCSFLIAALVYSAKVQDFSVFIYTALLLIYLPVLCLGWKYGVEQKFYLSECKSHKGVDDEQSFANNGGQISVQPADSSGTIKSCHNEDNVLDTKKPSAGCLAAAIKVSILFIGFTYAFVIPIFGLQDMGAPTMFAMLDVYIGATNHFVLPTGVLFNVYGQYNTLSPESVCTGSGSPQCSESDSLCDVYSGGIVRIESTNSEWINRLFPGETTNILEPYPRAGQLLRQGGNSGRVFTPQGTRVLGADGIYWITRPVDRVTPFLLPAIELRRLIAEAKEQGEKNFFVNYSRIPTKNREQVRGTSNSLWPPVVGMSTVYFKQMEDHEVSCTSTKHCVANGKSVTEPCSPHEIALQQKPPWWARKFLLFFPMPIPVGSDHELGCRS
eukprot:gnl/MRDRNA2_/MRDRNA2_35383_c0_seq1.p1 gnl/MRDRNA2_/MRDRNA2_35383_c0~~gnl/MRDRNA2_/MRDRNA2_35383_c0_seq1.p1  ORF type:complete len:665 (+),score=75.67 gnl/MRDRNA2_/MRDRNA2_35383_c0_seq1:38-1996(+)